MDEVESTANLKRPPKPKPKPKLVGGSGSESGSANRNGSGSRFECAKCPKTFSRIENLTRHQANHDDIGKFPCVVCKKRFTRSDLLNRHRRIHGPQPESLHVMKTEPASPSPDQRLDSSPVSHNGSWSASLTALSPSAIYQQATPPSQSIGVYQQATTGILPQREGYQHLLQPGPTPVPGLATGLPGLTSLMEAALAPQDNFSFTPAEDVNPSLWDGFMQFGENTSMYMGSYDADMSWTLDYLPLENSPNSLLDQDMLNVFDDYVDPYRYQVQQQFEPQLPANEAGDAEEEEEDSGDWPDQVEKPAKPARFARTIPIQLRQVSWQSVIDEARASGILANTILPTHHATDQLRNTLLDTLKESNLQNEVSRPDMLFPPAEALDYFLRLYVRYIQPRFPVLHLPTFDLYSSPPLLLVAMMLLGSSNSKIDGGRFSRLFYEHLRIACIRKQEIDKIWLRSIDNLLTYFLLCLAGTWSGSKHSYEFAEGGRGILVTAARRSRLLDNRPVASVDIGPYQRPGRTQMEAVWLAWIETEKRKRLGLSIYIFDCQYPALFNNQPYVSKAETTNCVFPCSEELWEAHSSEMWKMLVGPPDMPPPTYYLHALNCCLLRKWIRPAPPIVRAGEFGKIVLIYALHTHIFEWRQATSMLNPTGLMGTFGNSAHDMGDGLRERRKWLIDGLDSFAECYKNPATSTAALLLHYLGYVSLDVSLSDMHLLAGRSVNRNDGCFAEENLKFWANSTISEGTMGHVYAMLQLCHQCIDSGVAADASYEIAVSLFTGGIVCWAFAKLKLGGRQRLEKTCRDGGEVGSMAEGMEQYVEQVRMASSALRRMGCWRMCSIFGRILEGFKEKM
ncbi:C2H2 type zinc finger domain protein [Diplocarpon rosae]|nr:C2H2 type zinc finger domain protein [Diplocarpon rosae]